MPQHVFLPAPISDLNITQKCYQKMTENLFTFKLLSLDLRASCHLESTIIQFDMVELHLLKLPYQ